MLMRPRIGRRMVRTAAVGGAAYMVGSHAATKSMQQQQQEAAQDAQIAELQQQAPVTQAQAAPPQYTPEATPTAPAPTPTGAAAATRDPIEALKELGELRTAGVLTDEEFEAKKAQLLKQI